MSKGYVYILSNPSMPGIFKIGKTTRSVEQRCNELWQTGVPTPFGVEHQVLCPDCHELEAWMHKHFSKDRVSTSREFFTCSPFEATFFLDYYLKEQVTALIDEYMPNHEIVEMDLALNQADVTLLSTELAVDPREIVSAMGFLTPDEIAPAHDRWTERVRLRGEALKAGKPMPPIRPADEVTLQ